MDTISPCCASHTLRLPDLQQIGRRISRFTWRLNQENHCSRPQVNTWGCGLPA